MKPGGDAVRAMAEARSVPEKDVSVPFPEMVHGWVTRGDDTKDAAVARDQAEALRLCAEFILQHGQRESTTRN